MTPTLMTLKADSIWEPSRLLSPDPSGLWPEEPSRHLADVTSRVLAQPGRGGAVVRPNDVDPRTGILTLRGQSRADMVYRYGGAGGLRTGDLLLSAHWPVIHVSGAHRSLTFSSRFLAVRPNADVDALWLWVSLNSSVGSEVRNQVARRNSLGNAVSLRASDLPVPEPPDGWASARPHVKELLKRIDQGIERQDVGQSWWRFAELPGETSWGPTLAVADPSALEGGIPLSDFVAAHGTGRTPKHYADYPREGWLPIFGVPQVKGSRPERFASTADGVIANQGDILLQRVGLKGVAGVAASDCLIDSGLMWLRPKDGKDAHGVCESLNSAWGQRQRTLRITGMTIPSLSMASALQIRITEAADELDPTGPALAPELDQLVWA